MVVAEASAATAAPTRKIVHVDMDAFYASVEQRDRPELRGRPVVVGGDPQGRGVVAAASYEARRFGIHSAMPCAQARRRCPAAVFLRPDFARYKETSQAIQAIFHEVTDLVEPLSLDEAYLDVTENDWGEALAGKVALRLKRRIREELALTASAGVGPNKLIAKIASDLDKPDGLVIIPPDQALDFLAALPVRRLWGVGPATARRLEELGAADVTGLRRIPQPELVKHFGRHGAWLYRIARGDDSRPVSPERVAKSRSAETTFPEDITDRAQLVAALEGLAERVGRSLGRLDRSGRTVVLKVRYDDFVTVTRSKTLPRSTPRRRDPAPGRRHPSYSRAPKPAVAPSASSAWVSPALDDGRQRPDPAPPCPSRPGPSSPREARP